MISRGPNENSDRDGSNGMGFVPKTCKIRPVIKQNHGKINFSKKPKDFLSFEGPSSHRNPSQSLILVGPTLQMGRA